MRKPRVSVWYGAYGEWKVGVDGPLWIGGGWSTVVVATYTTRASANEYAKRLRAGLRGLALAEKASR